MDRKAYARDMREIAIIRQLDGPRDGFVLGEAKGGGELHVLYMVARQWVWKRRRESEAPVIRVPHRMHDEASTKTNRPNYKPNHISRWWRKASKIIRPAHDPPKKKLKPHLNNSPPILIPTKKRRNRRRGIIRSRCTGSSRRRR